MENRLEKYRIKFRKSVLDSFESLYYLTPVEARSKFRNLRREGYIGSVQHWNNKEQIWVG